MSLWDRLTGEFIDVIAWTDDTSDTMVWRFERYANEIKYGAKLTVREGQTAVFVHEGRIADVFTPGLYMLETNNMPILSTLQNWDHGFQSPFKSEIYFVSTRRFTDLKWGTKNPIILRDPEFGPTRLRAFGAYAMRVTDATKFMREIVGTDGEFTTDEISDQLRNILTARFSNALASSRIPVLDLAANTDHMADFLHKRTTPEIAQYGIEITSLTIENISLPEAVEKALDRRTSMGVIGDMRKYSQFQAAESMRAAAENPGGGGAAGMGAGMGMGMGWAMGRQMAGAFAPGSAPAAAPPPPPPQTVWHVAVDGETTGPFDAATLERQAREGRLTRDALVWSPNMAGWTRAGEVPALAGLFHASPPPPPPPPPSSSA